jgi:hypothetical protein
MQGVSPPAVGGLWPSHLRAEEVGRMKPLIVVADLDGCALCGLTEGRHPVLGFGHMNDTRNGLVTTKLFVKPSTDLLRERRAARRVDGYDIAEFHPVTGEPTTHFVRTTCRCGADALATRERVAAARCSACITADVRARGTS